MHSGTEDGIRWVLIAIDGYFCSHSKDGMLLKARGWERFARDSKQRAGLDHDK